jgi:hypothetical protein
MSRLEALVSECARPGIIVSDDGGNEDVCGDLLERNAILRHGLEATLPDESYVAGIGCGKAPGEEGGDSIAADCANSLCQLIVRHRWL